MVLPLYDLHFGVATFDSYGPLLGNITEEKESELEEFIDYSKIVMVALGHKLFEPLTDNAKSLNNPELPDEELKLFLSRYSNKSRMQINAECIQGS